MSKPKGVVLPFPRRERNEEHEFAERLHLEHCVLTQIDATLGHLRYQQSEMKFPKLSSRIMTKVRSAALPHVPSWPRVENHQNIDDLEGAAYCRVLRMKLQEQAERLRAEREQELRRGKIVCSRCPHKKQTCPTVHG